MREDKEYTEGIAVKKGKFLTWLDNYWYHYKWVTLVTVFFLAVFLICGIQMCTAEHDDLKVIYAGETQLSAEQQIEIENVLTEYLPEEFGKDESTRAGLSTNTILSNKTPKPVKVEDENGKLVNLVDENGEVVYITERTFNADDFNDLISQMQTGIGSVILMDRFLYEEFQKVSDGFERFMPLKSALGSKPECAIDDYAVLLSDTKMYKENYAVFNCFSEETVIVLHNKLVHQKNYDKEEMAFKAYAAIYEEEK